MALSDEKFTRLTSSPIDFHLWGGVYVSMFEQCTVLETENGTRCFSTDGIICQASEAPADSRGAAAENVYQVNLIFLLQYQFRFSTSEILVQFYLLPMLLLSSLSEYCSSLSLAHIECSARWNWNNFNGKSIEKQLIFFISLFLARPHHSSSHDRYFAQQRRNLSFKSISWKLSNFALSPESEKKLRRMLLMAKNF